MKALAAFGVAALVLAQSAFAATNPWLGTWKLNHAKSTVTGSTVTAVKTPNGYHFDFGPVKYDVTEDGQDHEVMPGRTISLKSTGKNEWLRVNKIDGKETSRTTMSLSSDGKTLSMKSTGTRADGSTYSATSTEIRIGTGEGLAGTFKETKADNSAATVMTYSDAGGGKIKVDYPASKASEVMTFDGKPVVSQGPRVLPGSATAYTKVSGTEYKYTVTVNSKPYVGGVVTVSADGKVMKDVNWLMTKPTEKETEVFEKQ